ncbi:hypothetical protein Y032_0118g736 [Ancylostoma ceylanicum]|uniref:Secreted protein n=1 Tax=Ancylostoma ceylanicum TaxID=53326 RepID=A0A016TBJ6_9BILA|nr:hypothetical protein Y032_0118g736 [Ancylostoma ceylanicum]
MIKCRHLILLLSCLALQVLSHHDNVLQGPCAIFSCFGSSSDLRVPISDTHATFPHILEDITAVPLSKRPRWHCYRASLTLPRVKLLTSVLMMGKFV